METWLTFSSSNRVLEVGGEGELGAEHLSYNLGRVLDMLTSPAARPKITKSLLRHTQKWKCDFENHQH